VSIAAQTMTIAAGHGGAFSLPQGRRLRVTTVEGSQVVDTWALAAADPGEWLSMEHTRGLLSKLSPQTGDLLYSNRRRPVLALVEDTSPGVHDTLIAACDQARYAQLGHTGAHRNCVENFRAAVSASGRAVPAVPSPLNLFMNVPVAADGRLELAPSAAARGDSVTLEALVDVVVVVSACPQDLVPINGAALTPTDIAVDLLP
jgi:uncharacterized protein YcgI (DUF1989 family)